MDREQAAAKLKKIKALAEKGVGGEKETAIRLYEELKEKYDVEEAEIMEDKVEEHWFTYSTEWELKLLIRIFYMVTGSSSYIHYTGKYSRRKRRGCECTELEAAEIKMYFAHYKVLLEDELDTFWIAFVQAQELFPDENARCYKESESNREELTPEERRKLKKAALLSMGIDVIRPQKLLGEMEEED